MDNNVWLCYPVKGLDVRQVCGDYSKNTRCRYSGDIVHVVQCPGILLASIGPWSCWYHFCATIEDSMPSPPANAWTIVTCESGGQDLIECANRNECQSVANGALSHFLDHRLALLPQLINGQCEGAGELHFCDNNDSSQGSHRLMLSHCHGFAMDFKTTETALSAALVKATRAVSMFTEEDVAFQRSSNVNLGHRVDVEYDRLATLGRRTTRRSSLSSSSVNFKEVIGALDVNDPQWRQAIDHLDVLLEKADSSLDEYTGLTHKRTTAEAQHLASSRPRQSRLPKTFRTQNIVKPQLGFASNLSNHSSQPFKPLLSKKPHSIVPFSESLEAIPNETGVLQYQHPYAPEIQQYTYPETVRCKTEPIQFAPFDTTQPTFVEDMDGVRLMLNELKKAEEIAIDLEHHDAHSYLGIVSLMQISTRENDWIVDTLKSWRRELEVLNEVLADPAILKVFHGAHSDAIWLQRDFGLYVVGLFDTYHASHALGYPGHSLAYLLKRFVGFDAKKEYQTSDWRIRPLPQELIDYARSDTHFLLYIYDNMRNELLSVSETRLPEEDKVAYVLENSKETSLQRFEFPTYDDQGRGPHGWWRTMQRSPWQNLSPQQTTVFRRLHQWRDKLARDEDESPLQIMSNHVLFVLASNMPEEVSDLLALSHPISTFTRSNAADLVELIRSIRSDIPHQINEASAISNSTARGEDLTRSVSARSMLSSFWGSTTDVERSHVADLSHISDVHCLLRLSMAASSRAMSPANNNIAIAPEERLIAPSASLRQTPRPNQVDDYQSPNQDYFEPKIESRAHKRDSDGALKHVKSLAGQDQDPCNRDLQGRMVRKRADAQHKGGPQSTRADGSFSGPGPSNGSIVGAIDYTSQPSLLNTTLSSSTAKRANAAPVFDPYAMAAHASNGLKKSSVRTKERSKTFRS